MSSSPVWSDQQTVRCQLSRHLVGAGVELGPGHHPFPVVYGGTEVTYIDRWLPDENKALFPELGEAAEFPKPDIVCNFNVDRLKPLDDQSQDFVIASHLLEHVADPLGLLHEFHRVLRPGGTALILLPDRRRTFDRGRAPTPLEHVVHEFEAQVTEVDDDHLLEFMRDVEGPEYFAAFQGSSPAEREAELDRQRRRSIHAHCWHEDEFVEVLLHAVEHLGHTWELVDGVLADDEGPEGHEFGYVLRRSPVTDIRPEDRRRRLAETWETWTTERRQGHDLRRELEYLRLVLAAASARKPWKATLKDVARPVVRPARRLLHRSPA